MLDVAKKCENLLVLNHVSTAYTGCNRFGVIKEETHTLGKDPERLLSELMKQDAKVPEPMPILIINALHSLFTPVNS